MSAELIKRIRRNREIRVPIGKFTFIARRLTDTEAVEIYRAGTAFSEIATRFVSGWEGPTEDDIVGGGGTDAVAFDAELWKEWCADRPDFWGGIANAVLDAYKQHTDAMEVAAKN